MYWARKGNLVSLGLYKILSHSTLPKGGAEEVGNKAWNLMRMTAAGLPVPAGFVLPSAWCQLSRAEAAEKDLRETLSSGIATLEAATGLGFGCPRRPLLVSVRSGAATSMPGMMETVLNIGINLEIAEGLTGHTGNPRLAWDCYRRLIQGYAEVVQRLPRGPFDELVAQALSCSRVKAERELDYATLRQLTRNLLDRFHQLAGIRFPDDPHEQLRKAAVAVFRSWEAPKAVAYRRANGIAHDGGTAVTVQRMVFGNASGASGAGVAFTRNPASGANELYLDFEFNAQGEDVVAGRLVARGDERLRRTLPSVWAQLEKASRELEALFRDAQDFEFTLESGALYFLQSRSAKRTPWAALRIAVEQVDEGLISTSEALSHLADVDLDSVVRTRLADSTTEPLAHAQVASIGVASGVIALDSEAAIHMANAGTPVILVRRETETADLSGMMSALGILTGAGGRTSHAAVVARQLGKVCLVSCPDLEIDPIRRFCRIGEKALQEGEFLSLDGNHGGIYSGKLEVVTERPEQELTRIARWQTSVRVENNLAESAAKTSR
jgi:pyruvate,orthophosphate dikinase